MKKPPMKPVTTTHGFDARGRLHRLHKAQNHDVDTRSDHGYYIHRDTGKGLDFWGDPYSKLNVRDVRDVFPSRRYVHERD